MGEKIKDLSSFEIGNEKIVIELNEGYNPKFSKYDIHIQSDFMQYNLTNSDFMRLASTMITSLRKLESIKE